MALKRHPLHKVGLTTTEKRRKKQRQGTLARLVLDLLALTDTDEVFGLVEAESLTAGG
jgi:hypothetical protein